MIPGLIRPFSFKAAGGAAATVSFQNHTVASPTASPNTLTSISFGATGTNRFIVVAIYTFVNTGSISITGVTLGGVTASALSDPGSVNTSTHLWDVSIWGAYVPTGTTGNIVVSTSATPNGLSVDTYACYNINSATPTATSRVSSTTATLSTTLSCSAGGIMIGAAGNNGTSNTWTGLTVGADHASDTSASQAFATAQTSLSIQDVSNGWAAGFTADLNVVALR